MPFLSPKRKVSDTENKLRVLFCLDKLGMATQEQLWPFVAQLELMEYMPFCLLADELRSDGAIAAGVHAMEGCLYLTADGRRQLELFGSRLVHADRQRIAAEAPAYARSLNERRQAHAAYELAPEGEYGACGTVCENDVPTLLLKLRSSRSQTAQRFVQRFSSVAAQMLAQLYLLPLARSAAALPEVLSQERALSCAAEGEPALCAYGGREHAAVVSIGAQEVRYTLLLLLPTAEMAWSWAQSAQARGEALARSLTALFDGEAP